jgi:hypothetical protein
LWGNHEVLQVTLIGWADSDRIYIDYSTPD